MWQAQRAPQILLTQNCVCRSLQAHCPLLGLSAQSCLRSRSCPRLLRQRPRPLSYTKKPQECFLLTVATPASQIQPSTWLDCTVSQYACPGMDGIKLVKQLLHRCMAGSPHFLAFALPLAPAAFVVGFLFGAMRPARSVCRGELRDS